VTASKSLDKKEKASIAGLFYYLFHHQRLMFSFTVITQRSNSQSSKTAIDSM
jgi:hypothetical protein